MEEARPLSAIRAAANAAAPPLPTVYSKDLNSEQIEFTIGAGTAAQRTVTIPYSYPRGDYRTMVYALVGGCGGVSGCWLDWVPHPLQLPSRQATTPWWLAVEVGWAAMAVSLDVNPACAEVVSVQACQGERHA